MGKTAAKQLKSELKQANKSISQAINSANLQQSVFSQQQQAYANAAFQATQYNNSFNAQQAQLSRDYQTFMSNTAHQREVADLKAAGINPVLSAYGSGASTPSGATASADASYAQMLGSLANSALNAVSNLSQAQLNVVSNQASADKANAMNKYQTKVNYKIQMNAQKNQMQIAILQNQTSKDIAYANNANQLEIANIQAATSRENAQLAAQTQLDIADINAFQAKYAANLSYIANQHKTNSGNALAEKQLLQQKAIAELQIGAGAATSLINGLVSNAGKAGKAGKGSAKKANSGAGRISGAANLGFAFSNATRDMYDKGMSDLMKQKAKAKKAR